MKFKINKCELINCIHLEKSTFKMELISKEEIVDLIITKYLVSGITIFLTISSIFFMFHHTIVRSLYFLSFCSVFLTTMWVLISLEDKEILKGNNRYLKTLKIFKY